MHINRIAPLAPASWLRFQAPRGRVPGFDHVRRERDRGRQLPGHRGRHPVRQLRRYRRKDISKDLKVRCTNGLPYTVKLSAGSGGGFAPRKLASGSDTLEYNLYLTRASPRSGRRHRQHLRRHRHGCRHVALSKEQTHTIFANLPNSARTRTRRPATTPTRSRRGLVLTRAGTCAMPIASSHSLSRAGGSRLAAAGVGRTFTISPLRVDLSRPRQRRP